MHCALIGSLAAGVLAVSCSKGEPRAVGNNEGSAAVTPTSGPPDGSAAQTASPEEERERAYEAQRERLVRVLRAEGISDERVLSALRRVPRHRMVPEELRPQAYANHPLPIGHEQTISQPYIVALMTALAELAPGEKVLEIGTGSGYQAAVLAEMGARVFSIEVIPSLGRRAREVLDQLGHAEAVQIRIGDGYRGWPEQAPFDAIVVTAAPPSIPEPLAEQLAMGGRLVVPVGKAFQQLMVLVKTPDGLERRRSIPVRFVPMVGEVQRQ